MDKPNGESGNLPILQVERAGFAYNQGKRVFGNVSFALDRGRSFSIIGPNGAGKSTLLGCLANLLPLKEGRILIAGKPLDRLSRHEGARIIGFVPQSLASVYGYSVMDFVVMGRAPYISNFRLPADEDYDRVVEVLRQLGITHLAEKPYTEISGGEQQQAALARVLVQDPEIILLDEPTSALDFGNQLKIIRLIKELTGKGYAVVMTTHNPDHAIMLADQVGILDRSGTLHVGEAKEVINEEILSQVYDTEVTLAYVNEVGRNACLAKL